MLLFSLLGTASASSVGRTSPFDSVPTGKTRAPHPEPRVIVKVTSVRGPHVRGEVEHSARLGWGRIVRCYKSVPQREKGMIALELVISGYGKVTQARRTRSTLESHKLAACLTLAIKGLAMPKASARSIAVAEVHVAPGDPP